MDLRSFPFQLFLESTFFGGRKKGSESLGIESVNIDLLNIVNGPDNSLFAFLSCCTLGALFSEDYSPIDPNCAKNELRWQASFL